jgi:hypothetical protein
MELVEEKPSINLLQAFILHCGVQLSCKTCLVSLTGIEDILRSVAHLTHQVIPEGVQLEHGETRPLCIESTLDNIWIAFFLTPTTLSWHSIALSHKFQTEVGTI